MVVGTASLVLVVVAGISGRAYTLDILRGVGTNLIAISHESADTVVGTRALEDRLNMGDLKAIRDEIPGVQSVAPQIIRFPTIVLDGVSNVVSLIGTTAEYRNVRNIQVPRGRFLDENDERLRSKVCLVTEILARKLQRDWNHERNADHGN
jgi:putative ABC transport system permease protein